MVLIFAIARASEFGTAMAYDPFRRAVQLDSMRRCRRGLIESRSEARCVRLARSSSAAALPGQAAQGHPSKRGATPGAAFFWLLFLAAQEK